MLFAILVIVLLKKVNSVVMWWKNFNKELVMTKEDNEDFENSTKCLICYNDYVHGDVKGGDHCHITGKYRGSALRDQVHK